MTITTTPRIPEELYQELLAFTRHHPGWSLDRVCTAAIALFLMQNSPTDSRLSVQHYLAAMFEAKR